MEHHRSINHSPKGNNISLERLHKQVPQEDAPNLVYTLVPLDQLAVIEKEIKHCLLELVKVDNLGGEGVTLSTESLHKESKHS